MVVVLAMAGTTAASELGPPLPEDSMQGTQVGALFVMRPINCSVTVPCYCLVLPHSLWHVCKRSTL